MCSPSPDDALEPQLSISDMEVLRSQLGNAIQSHQSIAMLDIGEKHCRLMISEGEKGHPQPVFHHIPLGMDLLAVRTFKHRMPTEAQLEQAIMLVEDAVMPLAHLIPASNVLVTRDPCLLDVAQHALGLQDISEAWDGTETLPVLRREAVESQFDLLVRQAAHPQFPMHGLPYSPRWAAALVILREVLHHWQVGAVRLLPTVPAPLQPPKG